MIQPATVKGQGTWWCNVHQRKATSVEHGKRCCNPNLGGILLPCAVVFAPMVVERRKPVLRLQKVFH